jgi:hypothetical protein
MSGSQVYNSLIVDLGCAYAAQSFFFDHHAKYIGIDAHTPVSARFKTSNAEHFEMTILDYLAGHAGSLDQGTTFAVCSYVPRWHDDNQRLAREFFKNVFTYYPCSRNRPDLNEDA